ncbi:MAG: S1 RNA-binding domain-containing protein, partial [Planctomycetes bacterium]|nr:S1 RNA-binding domain-containing protein [Planctomycetota bacterium]
MATSSPGSTTRPACALARPWPSASASDFSPRAQLGTSSEPLRAPAEAARATFSAGERRRGLSYWPPTPQPWARPARANQFELRGSPVTSIHIVEELAREFSITPEQVQSTLEMLDAGLRAPFIGRVRGAATGGLPERVVRYVAQRRDELAELDRRRGTILRSLEGEGNHVKADEATLERVRRCVDRFELEDLFLPHRRPEPEVQLALDRGLGRLADELVTPLPKELRAPSAQGHDVGNSDVDPADAENDADQHDVDHRDADQHDADQREADHREADPSAVEQRDAERSEAQPHGDDAAEGSAPQTQGHAHGEHAPAEPHEPASSEAPAAEAAGEAAAAEGASEEAEAGEPSPTVKVSLEGLSPDEHKLLHGEYEVTPELARLCEQYVNPDKGLHTATEVLKGALRILSDRLGRNPRLRGTIRKLLRKNGLITVRPSGDEGRLGRHRPIAKLRAPLRQLQGHKLIAIRQAQKERAVTMAISLDRHIALPKVRAALGAHLKPEFRSVLESVALTTLEHRLLPLIEGDVRLELKERADEEALRFLAQHLRQVLLASHLGRKAVCGVDVGAKGDWTIAFLDEQGAVRGTPTKIELGEKDDAALGAELKAAAEAAGEPRPLAMALGHSRPARNALAKLRAALRTLDDRTPVMLVNDAGLSSYTNSDAARAEFAELAVPARAAISLGRRLQDPLAEILKIDPKHLGLGAEQGLVSKANLRRTLDETVESCVALVGCDVNRAPLSILRHLPGLDEAAAHKLIERRAQSQFSSRDDLRSEGLLSEAQWTNCAASLRISGGSEPLDRTSLHPEQYEIARRVLESSGGSAAESLGRPGVTKGLRRVDFGVDDHVWRDLMRELWHPGRDPRVPLHLPRFLSHDTDRVTLSKDRVIEGVISNVASFGAFVDIGLEQDGMVHVSEISDRYVRDARELVSVGDCVRLRIVDGQSARVALSLKNVPDPERPPRREERGERPPRGERGERGERG